MFTPTMLTTSARFCTAVVLALTLTVACSPSTPLPVGTPSRHRERASQCPPLLPPPSRDGGPDGGNDRDAIPRCSEDDQCGSEEACACAVPCDIWANDSLANVCLRGNCRVDKDCGATGYCSLSLVPGGECYGAARYMGYFCHTANDECSSNGDCAHLGVHHDYCLYMGDIWRCGGGI